MGMVGNDMGKFMQYQTAQAIPKMAAAGAGNGGGSATPWAWALAWPLGQVLAQNLQQACAAGGAARRLLQRPRWASSPTK